MAGRSRELGFLERNGVISLKEQLARTTLRNVRLKGHTYIELREDNKKVIFFCVLCLSPCYSDSVLHDHLRGHLHKQMYEAAKATLLKQNPFPFNDGMLFFHNSSDEDNHLSTANALCGRNLLQKRSINENSLAIVTIEGNVSDYEFSSEESLDSVRGEESLDIDDLIIPDVLYKDKLSDLEVREIGVGKISIRYCERDGVSKGIRKIWCEWLGKSDSVNDDVIPFHDFAVVSFAFDCDLGRKGLLEDLQDILSSSSRPAIVGNNNADGKKRKSPSDPQDFTEPLSNNQYESSGEESLVPGSSNSRSLLDVYDDKSLQLRLVPSKCTRKEIRTRQRLASERVCDICQHKMLPGKNVATLLNMKTGRMVCSSRNLNGAFHVFHISCLIHWVLLCDSEVYTKQLEGPEVKRRYRRKKGARLEKVVKETRKQIYSAFCPECQGTGIDIDGDELEKPTISLSEMFKYKMKASDGHKEYIKNPELLQNCSTGFDFPSQSKEAMQENVSPLKLLRFYHAAA
ncbi:uncharacterized protein LOC112525084 [Cynara cardunculus var. scolymus]|uniref:uncharacterized protein LOC112525084 n=1 Tax=Cynara cardunculus var. scolymus TaxID=59895 RepID=UPI000D62B42E|nr:uncharacterized protein LOC112525084 [Cynara cardunculus var. scolymus]